MSLIYLSAQIIENYLGSKNNVLKAQKNNWVSIKNEISWQLVIYASDSKNSNQIIKTSEKYNDIILEAQDITQKSNVI